MVGSVNRRLLHVLWISLALVIATVAIPAMVIFKFGNNWPVWLKVYLLLLSFVGFGVGVGGIGVWYRGNYPLLPKTAFGRIAVVIGILLGGVGPGLGGPWLVLLPLGGVLIAVSYLDRAPKEIRGANTKPRS